MNAVRVPRGGVMAAWLVWMVGVASVMGGCTLLFGADEHQGGAADGGTDSGVDDQGGGDGSLDEGMDLADRCEDDPDADDDGHNAVECGGDDCDDSRDDVFPGAPEVCGNGVNEECGDAALRQLLGGEATVTQHEPRSLFSLASPSVGGTPVVVPMAMASTTQGGGWFVAATISGSSGTNNLAALSAPASDPTTYTQIANFIAQPPQLDGLVSVALARDGMDGASPDITMLALRRDPSGSDIAAHVGDIDASGGTIAITALNAITTTENVVFRPGAFMTDSLEPRWVVGEVGAATIVDRLNSCRRLDPGSCEEVDSTLGGLPDTSPVLGAGSPSGHVFFTDSSESLGVWDLTPNGVDTTAASTLLSGGLAILGRPAVAQVALVAGAPNRHHYVVALRHEVDVDGTRVVRLALVSAVCARAQQLGTCSFGSAEILPNDAGTPSGPMDLVSYGGGGRFALFYGTRAAGGDALRMVTGTYDPDAPAADAISIVGTRAIATFQGNSNALLDVAANYLQRPGETSIISVMWQQRVTLVQLNTTAFSFCLEP
jgi:hypothetical protein